MRREKIPLCESPLVRDFVRLSRRMNEKEKKLTKYTNFEATNKRDEQKKRQTEILFEIVGVSAGDV